MANIKLFALNESVLFFEEYSNSIPTGTIMRNIPNYLKYLRRLHFNLLDRTFPEIWFTEDFKNCGKYYDSIIIFDSILTIPAVKYIHKRYPNLRIIYWFWNHIYKPELLLNLPINIELWSYDIEDCKKYNLKHNSQFYFNNFNTARTTPITQDCIFVGAEKGRKKELEFCAKMIDDSNLSRKFIVAESNRKDRKNKWIPYNELLEMVNQSRCIVDIVPRDVNGLTLRPLEALFLGKKLITNYNRIKEFDFYNPSNIFIIEYDNPTNLKEFLDSPSSPVDISIKEYYLFDNWIKRFL